jgi:prepilin-type N-terminal cleavage/methylation domain-containing protein
MKTIKQKPHKLIPSSYQLSGGFTLIELIISMAIMSMLAFFLVRFAGDLTTSSVDLNRQLLAQEEIHATLRMLQPELRGSNQSVNGAYQLASVGTSTLGFYSDIDGDGVPEKVRYFLNGTTLMKGIIKPSGAPLGYATSTERTQELVKQIVVGTQLFSYYDKDATSTISNPLPQPVDPSLVKSVKITIVANQGTTLHTSLVGGAASVTIRSLRYK